MPNIPLTEGLWKQNHSKWTVPKPGCKDTLQILIVFQQRTKTQVPDKYTRIRPHKPKDHKNTILSNSYFSAQQHGEQWSTLPKILYQNPK